MAELHELIEGKPLAYLPAEALPSIVTILSKGAPLTFRVRGQLVEVDGRLLLEIDRVELERR